MPALDNPRHERFCQLKVKPRGETAELSDAEAYMLAYGCSQESAHTNAWLIAKDPDILGRIKELNSKAIDKAQEAILSKAEALEFCAQVVRTPIGEIDENHPLAQCVKRSPEGNVIEVKMPAKMDALKLNAQMQGWVTERKEIDVRLSVFGPQEEKRVLDVES